MLLRTAHALWPDAVAAIHVNHGLQATATEFEAHCIATCQHLGVGLTVMRATIQVQPGDSVEEQARRARYSLLQQAAKTLNAGVVWLAQHADDQAETVLLALSRGAGLAGLAAMGELSVRDGLHFGRPFLAVPHALLQRVALAHGWPFVDDPSNHNTQYTRNRIRHEVMPTLLKAFPQWVTTLARTAQHCAQADDLLRDLARLDLLATGVPPSVASLQRLSVARQANALRCWLRDATGRAPSAAQLNELLKQTAAAVTRGHRIDIKIGVGRVVRTGQHLVYVPPLSASPSGAGKTGP